MNIQYLLKSKDIEILKQKAKKLKKEKNISHTEALDEIAKQHKFNHWHHVTESYKILEPTETAFKTGVIIAMDAKDGDDFYDEHGLFIEDDFAFWFCKEDLFRAYGEMLDDGDIPIKDLYSEEELKQDFEEDHMMNYMFFRYTGTPLKTVEEVNALVRERCFWLPQYIWLNGKLHDTSLEPSVVDGEVVGVRF